MHSEYESHEGNITFHVCPHLLWLSHNLTLYWLSYTLLYIEKNSLPKDQTSATFPTKKELFWLFQRKSLPLQRFF